MNKEEVVELLEYLKEQVSGPAEQVFRMAVRYQLTSAIIWLVVGLGFLTAGGSWLRWAIRHEFSGYDDDIQKGFSIGGAGVVTFVGLIMVLVNVQSLVNIEYVALRSLLP